MNVKSNILFRIYLIGALCLIFGVAVLGKVYQIQTDDNHHWKTLADSLTTKLFDVTAERGNIFSADDKLLATSVPYFDLYVDFGSKAMSQEIFDRNVDSLAFYMWKYFNKNSVQEYSQQLKKAKKIGRRYFPFYAKADYILMKEIKKWPLFREGKFKGGLIIERHQKRINPFGDLALRTIGLKRVNAKDIGLEESADSLLHGINGKILKQIIN